MPERNLYQHMGNWFTSVSTLKIRISFLNFLPQNIIIPWRSFHVQYILLDISNTLQIFCKCAFYLLTYILKFFSPCPSKTGFWNILCFILPIMSNNGTKILVFCSSMRLTCLRYLIWWRNIIQICCYKLKS
jgi:hypothetical protein